MVFIILTVLTQLGGVALLLSRMFRHRILAFVVIYLGLAVAAMWVAPAFGRVAISCFQSGPLQVQSEVYCGLNRTYVTPEMRDVLEDAADAMARDYPGTVTMLLDANFPFFDGFPLLPHLSHDDGEKADLAFYYTDDGQYVPGDARAPLGYFAFKDGPTTCPPAWPTLRCDMAWLQAGWHDYALDELRTAAQMDRFISDQRVGKIFIEPHLAQTLGLNDPKVRFQGCRAARHDDHIHIQLN